jgi:nitrile hydratase accessory protein
MAEATIPRIGADCPLFPAAWHARIFALIVAMVESGQIDWQRFQPLLVEHLKEHEDVTRSGDDISAHYFEHWLEAAEEAFVESGFLNDMEIPEQLERIRTSIDAIRLEQASKGEMRNRFRKRGRLHAT